jgi:hypothetical protein
MTARAEKEALEAAGFVRLPTLWVYPEEAARIYQIAKKHRARVHEIRNGASRPIRNDN